MKKAENVQKCELEQNFINYFSMGYEARIGFGQYLSLILKYIQIQVLIKIEQNPNVVIEWYIFGRDVRNHAVEKQCL